MNQDLLKYCRYYKGEKECPYEGIEFSSIDVGIQKEFG